MTQRRKSAWRALAWAAVFLVFAGLAAVFLFNSTRRAEAPAIASVQGEVRLRGPKGERVLRSGQSWPRGETLKTVGANSTAKVTLRDGTRLDFSGNSVAVNQSTKEGCRVDLEHGAVRGLLKKQPDGHPFVFATPEAEAIVVGTALRLVTGAHHTRLEVTEGEVRFRRLHDGAQVTVKTGYCAVVAPNAPLVATPFGVGDTRVEVPRRYSKGGRKCDAAAGTPLQNPVGPRLATDANQCPARRSSHRTAQLDTIDQQVQRDT
jgi:hypothetical protein